MAGVIDQAFIEIKPLLSNFTGKLKAQVDETVATSEASLAGVSHNASRHVEEAAVETEGFLGRLKEQMLELAKFALPAIGAVEIYKTITESIAAAREEQKQLAQTSAVIKSTGEAAHVSAKDVEELAIEQSKHTGVTQTAIRANENLLLTFTNVRNEAGKGNDIFNQATKTTLDMAAALKEGGRAASLQLGKALNDPIRGMTALRRVGVSFTQQQQDQVKAMVQSGHRMQAQKLILHELNKEFGGSAAAQATAGEKMKAAWEAVQVQLGDKLLPVIDKVEGFITNHVIPGVLKLAEAGGHFLGPIFHAVGQQLSVFGKVLAPMMPALEQLGQTIFTAWQAFNPFGVILRALEPILPVVAKAVGSIANALGYDLWEAMQAITPALKQISALIGLVARIIVTAALPVIEMLAKTFGQVMDILTPIIPVIADALVNAFKQLIPLIRLIIMSFAQLLKSLMPLIPPLAKIFVTLLGLAIKIIKALLPPLIVVVSFLIRNFVNALTTVINIVVVVIMWFTRLGDHAKQLWRAIDSAFHAVLDWFDKLGGKIASIFRDAIHWLTDAGKNIIHGLWVGIKWFWDNVLFTYYVRIPRWILSVFVDAVRWLVNAGKNIITGLWNGIKNVWASTITWINRIDTWIIGVFINAVRWLVGAGRNIITGLWNGIKNVWSTVSGWLGGMGRRILSFFGNAATWLIGSGARIIRGLWTGLTNAAHMVVDWFKAIPGKILGWLGIHSPPSWAIDAGKWIVRGLVRGMGAMAGILKNAVLGIWHGIAGLLPGAGHATLSTSSSARAEQEFAMKLFRNYNWSPGEINPLINLWNGESGWNPRATNPSSGAYGIPQALPASKMASAGADWRTNPATQIQWGLNYIHERYGSPSAAYSAWLSRNPHWYQHGAWEVPEDNHLAVLHRKEMVVPADQAEKFRQVQQPITAEALATAVARAINGATLYVDPSGVARLVTMQQGIHAIKGVHR